MTVDGLPPVRENVKLHKGWFDEVLPGFKQEFEGPLAFLHLDADLYSSTKVVLDELAERVGPGTVIQFDEYFNYPGWKQGEFKAFAEFVEAVNLKYEYLGYCSGDDVEQIAIRVTSIGSENHSPAD